VHKPLLPALAAQKLRRAVGEHLVHIHVALRAGARLPHHQRELAVVPPAKHLVGGALDRLRLFWVQQTETCVHGSRGFLHAREGVDDGERHALAGDAEEAAAALGLGAPQPVGGHLDGAEAVLFGAAFFGGAGHPG